MSLALNNKYVVADPNLCIGCTTCMAACYESAYNRGKLATPRLIVTRTASGTMPNQCRQCDDAPCANVCPVGALEFGKDAILLHEEICIGCKMCTLACPFGAIRPEAELMPSVNYSIEAKYNLGIQSEVGAKSIAVKCDLCVGSEDGPACVGVCPTNALSFENVSNNNFIDDKAHLAIETFVKERAKFL